MQKFAVSLNRLSKSAFYYFGWDKALAITLDYRIMYQPDALEGVNALNGELGGVVNAVEHYPARPRAQPVLHEESLRCVVKVLVPADCHTSRLLCGTVRDVGHLSRCLLAVKGLAYDVLSLNASQ